MYNGKQPATVFSVLGIPDIVKKYLLIFSTYVKQIERSQQQEQYKWWKRFIIYNLAKMKKYN